MPSLAEVNVRIGANIDQLQRNLRRAERSLIRSGRKLGRLGNELTTSISIPLAAAGAAALKFSADFETSFTRINTLVGVTGNELKEFEQGINDLSGPLGQSKKELSDALFVITSAGQRGSQALEILEQASKASAIGLGETEDIARAATGALTAYADTGLTAGQAIDQFTAIVRAGNLEASQLAPSLGKVLPIAAQLNVPLSEVGANIAAFTRLGVSAPEAVTALKAALSNILKPSAEASKELARVGLSADQLRQSIAEQGLAATLQQLVVAYGDNVEGLSKLFGSVEGLASVLGTAEAQGEDYLNIVNEIANSNGIVNEGFEKVSETANFKLQKALVNLQNAASQFGSVIIPVVTDLLTSITPLIERFSKLDESTKKNIVTFGLLAASVGPVLKVVGTLKTTYGSLIGVAGQLVGGIRKAAGAFLALNTAMKATVVGAVTAGIVTLVAVINDLNSKTDTATKLQENMININQAAERQLASNKAEIRKLTDALKEENISQDQQAKIKREIIALNPTYFKDLINEKSSVEDVTKALDGYIENLRKSARIKAANARLEELFDQLDNVKELAEQSGPTITQSLGNAFKSFGNAADFAFLQAQTGIQNFTDLQTSLNAEIDDTLKLIKELQGEPIAPGIEGETDRIKALGKLLADRLKNAGNKNFNTTAQADIAFSGFGSIDNLQVNTDAIDQSSLGLESLNTDFFVESQKGLQSAINASIISTADFNEELEKEAELLRQIGLANATIGEQLKALGEEGGIFGEVLGTALSSVFAEVERGEASLAKLGQTFLSGAAKQLRATIMQGVASAVSSALRGVPFPFNLAAGATAGVAAGALFNKALGALKIPAFAEGGLVFGPTLNLAGEYPGARNNPEVIAPLDRLQGMLDTGNGFGDLLPQWRIEGDVLLLWLDRASSRRGRRVGA